ncbi:MAG TPA: helix-turn-helix domain-containing protein [Candidatus Binatia bacterium]|jgi:DeoR family suf operon transcriptional repressor|nr:helix-turn-helix domain-containing protein [Candidatus Binatia bacterium]
MRGSARGSTRGAATPATSEPFELAPVETAGTTVALDALSSGRRAVVEWIKREGEASTEEIAAALGVTVGAVRQHLAALEADGLVAHREERSGPGRPRRRHCLTPAGEGLWPKRYGQLANQVLGLVEQSDPELVDLVFEGRARDRVRRARHRLEDKGFDDRVRELAAILDEDGYLADCEKVEEGFWRIVEHNCAILDVAARYGAACRSEIRFLREAMPDAEIERVRHIVSGGHVCAYEVRARGSAPEPSAQ